MAANGPDPDDHDDPDHDAVADADAIADTLEDELADAVAEPNRKLPRSLAIPAALLVAAIAAPLTPDGHSFAQLLYAAFLRHPLEALITLIGFGSPFWFGALILVIVGAGQRMNAATATRAIVINASLMHTQLVLVAGMLVWRGEGLLPTALLGFAIVSGGFFILHHARSSAAASDFETLTPSGPSLRWIIRWVATVIVATCGWIRLQVLIDVRLGWAVELTLAACMMIAVLLTERQK